MSQHITIATYTLPLSVSLIPYFLLSMWVTIYWLLPINICDLYYHRSLEVTWYWSFLMFSSCFHIYLQCSLQWLFIVYVGVFLITNPSECLSLLPYFSVHKDTDTMQVVWLLVVYSHLLAFGDKHTYFPT